jgi:hypothetical protein
MDDLNCYLSYDCVPFDSAVGRPLKRTYRQIINTHNGHSDIIIIIIIVIIM